ncbi:ribbon-helix-helix domain-containing protein [Actinoallomurus rhizosphaericola]|uniref:hypothetical protein n=1 Tax=Actinoallomurus rhizosphaericola TaxID=2952536 RepID=UPI002090BC2A|nr:hypothetical protein [Actinoallomurus rhizosphaericola]MCO5991919.1 hypothetical protein [Actinoallomurus rhizosphaericola]
MDAMPETPGAATGEPERGKASAAGRSQSPLERVTVNLTPRSAAALDEVVRLTRDTKTDVINRALQVYAFLEKVMNEGGAVYIREAESTDVERLKFF